MAHPCRNMQQFHGEKHKTNTEKKKRKKVTHRRSLVPSVHGLSLKQSIKKPQQQEQLLTTNHPDIYIHNHTKIITMLLQLQHPLHMIHEQKRVRELQNLPTRSLSFMLVDHQEEEEEEEEGSRRRHQMRRWWH